MSFPSSRFGLWKTRVRCYTQLMYSPSTQIARLFFLCGPLPSAMYASTPDPASPPHAVQALRRPTCGRLGLGVEARNP